MGRHVDGGRESDDGFGFLSREGFGVEDEAKEGEVNDLEREREREFEVREKNRDDRREHSRVEER